MYTAIENVPRRTFPDRPYRQMNIDMSPLSSVLHSLENEPKSWLVTGAAGFIGSHLVETLLGAGQYVRGLDNYITGSKQNIEAVAGTGSGTFEMIEGDIRDLDTCMSACQDIDVVLHQAALGSVPRSVKDPQATHEHNVNGSLNVLSAARDCGVQRVVYASSSSVYGDNKDLPKEEDKIGTPLSPYAVSKRTVELYARTFFDHYKLGTIGLRYFNVFGPRQDPSGAYAAVIPRWVSALLKGEVPTVFGDGETSRDFCYVANVVQANLRAATAPKQAEGTVFNVAVGDTTSLNSLYETIASGLEANGSISAVPTASYEAFRPGDIRHSQANVERARDLLGYSPTHSVYDGMREALAWYTDALSV